jgi:hypothetical protein
MIVGEPQKPLHLLFILRHDILVLGHLANLSAVLVRFREYGLNMKPKKCGLFQKEVEFLGRVVGPRGMHIGPVLRFDFHLPIC